MDGDFHVGDWLVQPRLARLARDGAHLQVRAKVIDLLVFLARRGGEVVSKDELLHGVWGTDAVSESALTSTITELRQALADSAGHSHAIENIPKRGYRLILPVRPVVPPVEKADVPHPRARRAFALLRAHPFALGVAGLIAMTLAAGFATFVDARRAPRVPAIAVLPFDSANPPPGDGHFADGLHQEVVLRLGMIAGLKVTDRTATMRYRGRHAALSELSRDLGVDYVLRGTLSTDHGRIRFVPVLTDVNRQGERWTEQYDVDGSVANLMAIQSAVALDVAKALRVKISSAERGRISGRRTENAAAYELFLRAGEIPDPDRLAASLKREEFLLQAIELDRQFAAAVAALASTYADRSYSLGQRGDYADRAIVYARQAIEMDPDLGEGFRALALAYLDKGRLREAAMAFRRLADLQPSDGHALMVLGWIDYLKGHIADAVERWTAARTLSPFNPWLYLDLASAERLLGNVADSDHWSIVVEKVGGPPFAGVERLLRAGKSDEALITARQLVAANPGSIEALEFATETAVQNQQFTDARRFLEQLDRIATDDWNYWGLTYRTLYGYVLLQLGMKPEAQRILERTLRDALQRLENGDERPGVLREIAAIHAARGERQAASEWFDRAITAGWRLEAIHPAPPLDDLRNEPGFQRAVQRMQDDLSREDKDIQHRGLRHRLGP